MKIFHFIEITEEDIRAFLNLTKEIWIRISLPKNPKNKIGIVLAINTENEKEKIRLSNDLVYNLRKNLEVSELTNNFKIIQLSQRKSSLINTHKEAISYLRRIRGHLMVWGNISERTSQGKNNFYFNLEGVVLHRPVNELISRQLSKEFSELMPMKWSFPDSEELLGFQITEKWLGLTTRYIVGIALYISGLSKLSYDIFFSIGKELNNIADNVPAILEIRKRIPLRLVDVSSTICNQFYFSFAQTRNIEYIKKSKQYLDIVEKYSPLNYDINNLRAIYYFLVENDADKAISEIRKIGNSLDVGWRYNLGFLYAFKGDLETAKKEYNKAFKGYTSENFLNDTDIFISESLEKYPDKVQLLFMRGLLNLRGKGDKGSACKDFKEFIEKANLGLFFKEINLAKIYIKNIDSY